jgi:hypothetical protein
MFLDRYQRDVQAMAKIENKLFEHNHVLGEQAKGQYEATRKAHVERITSC